MRQLGILPQHPPSLPEPPSPGSAQTLEAGARDPRRGRRRVAPHIMGVEPQEVAQACMIMRTVQCSAQGGGQGAEDLEAAQVCATPLLWHHPPCPLPSSVRPPHVVMSMPVILPSSPPPPSQPQPAPSPSLGPHHAA